MGRGRVAVGVSGGDRRLWFPRAWDWGGGFKCWGLTSWVGRDSFFDFVVVTFLGGEWEGGHALVVKLFAQASLVFLVDSSCFFNFYHFAKKQSV